jgi:hypothetical protein
MSYTKKEIVSVDEKYEPYHLKSLISMMFDCAESGDYSGVCECGQDAKKEIDKIFTKARNICADVKEKR